MQIESTEKNWVSELENIMTRLRSRTGCPWDQEQTHESLKKYLIEEAYELVDAIDDHDPEQLRDELGDVLLQVIFHCQIAKEDEQFTLQDVAEHCSRKMLRRHPHVFGDEQADDSAAVLALWRRIKEDEQPSRARSSILDGVPRNLPALHQAEMIQRKAAKVGFDWSSSEQIIAKIEEELEELKKALESRDQENINEETGDLLFAVVNLCRYQNFNSAEDNLRKTINKFYERFRFIENKVSRDGKSVEDCSIDVLESYWQQAKTPAS